MYDVDTHEKMNSISTPAFKNTNSVHLLNMIDVKATKQNVEREKSTLERVGVLVDLSKKIVHWYNGTKSRGMELSCKGKARTWFENYGVHFSVSFGGGVCLICDDVELPSVLPENCSFLLGWNKEYYVHYPKQIQGEVKTMLLVRNRLNLTRKGPNKIPKVLIMHSFNFLFSNRQTLNQTVQQPQLEVPPPTVLHHPHSQETKQGCFI